MKQTGGRERGAAAVEFALVFVLLMSLILLILQVGILFAYQASAAAAAREGARMYAITGDASEGIAAAEAAFPFQGSIAAVPGGGTCGTPPDRSVEVTMTVTVTPAVFFSLFSNPSLSGEGAMRCGG